MSARRWARVAAWVHRRERLAVQREQPFTVVWWSTSDGKLYRDWKAVDAAYALAEHMDKLMTDSGRGLVVRQPAAHAEIVRGYVHGVTGDRVGERLAALAALDALLAERQQDKERIERLTEALTNVSDGELGNVCWCGEEWIGDDYPLDEERQHAEWCEAARAVLAGEGDATP